MRPKAVVFELQFGSIVDVIDLQAKRVLKGAALAVASSIHPPNIPLKRPVRRLGLAQAFEDDEAGFAALVERRTHKLLGCEFEGQPCVIFVPFDQIVAECAPVHCRVSLLGSVYHGSAA